MRKFYSTMKIGSIKKFSLVDFPGKRAVVVYTQGCDWDCPYCFYRSLVRPTRYQPAWPETEVFELLDRSDREVDAVVISGGEPLVQPGLDLFLRRLKRLGLAVKLETNGCNPELLRGLLSDELIDYVAMDVKGPLRTYARFAGCEVDPGVIELSMELIRESGVDYEFRTTLVGGLHSVEDVQEMVPLLAGAKRFAVQSYMRGGIASGREATLSPPSDGLLAASSAALKSVVGEFIIRG